MPLCSLCLNQAETKPGYRRTDPSLERGESCSRCGRMAQAERKDLNDAESVST